MSHLIAIFAPLVSFIILGIWGFRMGSMFSQIVSCVFMAFSFFGAVHVFSTVALCNESIHVSILPFIEAGAMKSHWGFYIDTLSAVMMVVVTTVSLLVHIYSVGYMDHDRTPSKFMAYLGLFTFMMLMLVTAENMLQLFFGWEGVGLASYLLIGYWYEKPSACAASIKAFVVNRVGDLGLILAMGGFFLLFQTLDIPTLLLKAPDITGTSFKLFNYSLPVLEVLGCLLFLGAMGKSAQFGLHTWLPDAMEGPTPVSALIHAATMVTAGVFLVARFSPLFELAPIAKNLMTYVGAFTAFFAGTVALTQTDIKRVIAYSTCSQLGYMFFAEGLGAYHLAMFHLTTHAFFKALLFLGAGSVIHAMSDEQDMRHMGGIWRAIPVTYTMMWVGSLALAGIPFFAGYYSKDAILEVAGAASTFPGVTAYTLGLASAFLTALYSWRLIYLTFHGTTRAHERVISHLHEPSFSMLAPLALLAIGAVFSGLVGAPYFQSQAFWGSALTLPSHHLVHEDSFFIHHLPTFMGIFGIALASILYLKKTSWPEKWAQNLPKLYALSFNKWYVDEFYEKVFVASSLKMGNIFWKKVDGALIDDKIINQTASWAQRVAKRLSQMHTGLIFHCALWMAISVAVLLFLMLLMERV